MINKIKQRIEKTHNKLLIAESNDVSKWANVLKEHSKSALELLLEFNIIEIQFKPKNSSTYRKIICTSNIPFINVYRAYQKKDKIKALSKPTLVFKKDRHIFSVISYDLIENKLKTINLRAWQIINMLSISMNNILLIDEIMNSVLKRAVIVEKNNDKTSKKISKADLNTILVHQTKKNK